MFFISFHCPKMFYCSPCPTAAPASLNIHVMSTNFAKTLVPNPITNSVYAVTMTTIRQCSILELCRGASNQAIAPGITRPLRATAYASTKNTENSQNFNLEGVMTIFWKFVETFRHNLQIFESRTFWRSLGLEVSTRSRSRSLGLDYCSAVKSVIGEVYKVLENRRSN